MGRYEWKVGRDLTLEQYRILNPFSSLLYGQSG